MQAMKAKEKEMKDEKEAERQVGCPNVYSHCSCSQSYSREKCNPSKTNVLQRLKKNDMRRWPRRCTRSGWNG